MKAALLTTTMALLFLVFFCGIYRHDVPKQKYRDLARQHQFDCVGHVFYKNKSWGSCVLIDKKHLLTAAHLFVKKGQSFSEASDFQFELNGKLHNAADIIVHQAYNKNESKGACDIAIVHLTEDVTDIIPAHINNNFDELHNDVVVVGFGPAKPSLPVDAPYEPSEKLAGENVVDSIWGFEINGHNTILTIDFDSPTDPGMNKTGSPTARGLEYMVSGGDSGGGLFRIVNGQWQLIGINAHAITTVHINGGGHYGSICDFTRVAAFVPWIQQEMGNSNK